jgi:hypothetical protein
MPKHFNRVKFHTPTTGNGNILTVGNIRNGYQSLEDAGAQNGDQFYYVVEEGYNWELGTAVYDSVAGTITKTPQQSSDSGSAITLYGRATVYVAMLASSLPNVEIVATSPESNQTLVYNGSRFVNQHLSTDKLSDINNTSKADGALLVYDSNSSKYVATKIIQNANTIIKGGSY